MRQLLPLCVPCVYCPVPGDSRHLHVNYTLNKGMTKGMPGYVKGTSLAVQVISEVGISCRTFLESGHNFFSEFPVLFVLMSDTQGYCAPEAWAGAGSSQMLCCVFERARGRSCAFGFFIGIKPTYLKAEEKF